MEITRFIIAFLFGSMAYFAVRHAIYSSIAQSPLNKWFAWLAGSVALFHLFWFLQTLQSDVFSAYLFLRLQWILNWLTLGIVASFTEILLGDDRGTFFKPFWLLSAGMIFLTLIPMDGLMFQGASSIILHQFSWGETIPILPSPMTPMRGLALIMTIGAYLWLLIKALRERKGLTFGQQGKLLSVSLLLTIVGLLHDLLASQGLWFHDPFRLRFAGMIFLIVIMDMTLMHDARRSRKLDKALAQNEASLGILIDNVPGILYQVLKTKDKGITVEMARGRIQDVLGEPAEGQDVMDKLFQGLEKTERKRCLDQSFNAYAERQPFHFEGKFTARDGNERWLRVSSVPSDEKASRYVGIILDQTAQWQNEQMLDHLNQELRAKNAEQEEVLYAASHDLRSPLLNVAGFAGEIRSEIDTLSSMAKDSPPEFRETLRERLVSVEQCLVFVENSIQRMSGLLDGLLAVNRSGRLPVNIGFVEAQDILMSVLSVLGHRIRTSDAKIHLERISPCLADPELLSQIFSNLLDNAIKYRASDHPLQIRIWSETRGDMV
ncbi:MAG TPA: hypothetical protein VLM37_06335, partial [Fibrobacteraceae bacterium]|nr:hypothetical protein [Fibrobacteraceae bacterium]